MTTTLYRGTGRSVDMSAVCANDMDAVFCTTSPETALYYADFGGAGRVLTLSLDDAARIADLTDAETVRTVLAWVRDYRADQWQGDDLDDDATLEAAVTEIIEAAGNLGDGAIMDDPAVAEAVCELGYDGARLNQQGGETWVIYRPELLTVVAVDGEAVA